MQQSTALGVAAAAAAWLGTASNAAAASLSRSDKEEIEIGEWSYFFLGIKRAELARGTVVGGQQMYVEYQIPARLRHPYPIVLVHGGGGQGTDWMGTPDGRYGWFQYLLQEGFAVYVVDRPGHGRPPYHPDLDGPFPPAPTLEFLVGSFTPPQPDTPNPSKFDLKHSQWPGTGGLGSRDLDQFAASQGGAYVQPPSFGPPPPPPPRPPVGGLHAFMQSGPVPANALAPTPPEAATALAHTVWRERGVELVDKIGPAIFMTHSAGGPFGHLVADARPDLVKGLIVIEGAVYPFNRGNRWGITTVPMTYDPPVHDPGELKAVQTASTDPDIPPYYLQAEPARRLKNLTHIPTLVVTSEASFASPGNPATVAFLEQAGCPAEELRLADAGIHGNGHMMMVEKNNREVLQPILDWIAKRIPASAPGSAPGSAPRAVEGAPAEASTGGRLRTQGFFWVGTEHKTVNYGTILRGQMYVQYLIPANPRHKYPVVLVHGGTGQMLHYMGNPGSPGWAHYYLQAGYAVYLVDRPGHGRAPYHPDALGPIGAQPTYELLLPDVRRGAAGHRWPGTGEIGDPLLDQLMASQNGAPQDNAMAQSLWASRGAELLDVIGPSIIQTHSAGGAFGWLAADQRPDLVKAIVVFEGAAAPLTAQSPWGVTAAPLAYDPPIASPSELASREVPAAGGGPPLRLQAEPARKLKNLQKIPMLYLTADNSGRSGGPGITEYLKQAGAPAEHLNLREKGILGNGHFAMLENNNREVFEVIRGWIEARVPSG